MFVIDEFRGAGGWKDGWHEAVTGSYPSEQPRTTSAPRVPNRAHSNPQAAASARWPSSFESPTQRRAARPPIPNSPSDFGPLRTRQACMIEPHAPALAFASVRACSHMQGYPVANLGLG